MLQCTSDCSEAPAALLPALVGFLSGPITMLYPTDSEDGPCNLSRAEYDERRMLQLIPASSRQASAVDEFRLLADRRGSLESKGQQGCLLLGHRRPLVYYTAA